VSIDNPSERYPSRARATWSLAVLYIAYVFAFVDRQIIAFLVDPIRKAFAISDFQFSLLNGLAFVLFYAVLGIVLGRLADRSNRRRLVAIGVGAWTIMTALCGRAGNFAQLFLARLGVGVGEAALAPAAVSLIADLFPRERRGLAINLFASGVHGGIGLANICGGLIVAATASMAAVSVPLLGEVQGWQMAFIAVAAPGIVVLPLVLTLREPARHGSAAQLAPVSFADTLQYMRQHGLVYGSLILGTALSAVGSYGMYGWVPAAFKRNFGWSSAAIGWHLGLLTLIFGTLGLALSGWYASRTLRAGGPALFSRLMGIAVALAVIPATLSLWVTTPTGLWVCVAAQIFLLGMPVGLVQGGLQAVTPNNRCAQVIAVYLTVLNMFGMGMGPSAVAYVTDFIFGNDQSVRYSIGIVIMASATASALVLFAGTRAYERLARAQALA
jgi:MFS family permease